MDVRFLSFPFHIIYLYIWFDVYHFFSFPSLSFFYSFLEESVSHHQRAFLIFSFLNLNSDENKTITKRLSVERQERRVLLYGLKIRRYIIRHKNLRKEVKNRLKRNVKNLIRKRLSSSAPSRRRDKTRCMHGCYRCFVKSYQIKHFVPGQHGLPSTARSIWSALFLRSVEFTSLLQMTVGQLTKHHETEL